MSPTNPTIPLTWPDDPSRLPIPPEPSPNPTSLTELEDVQLAELASFVKILCGRGVPPLKDPRRRLVCLLATILEYEVYKREHPH